MVDFFATVQIREGKWNAVFGGEDEEEKRDIVPYLAVKLEFSGRRRGRGRAWLCFAV